MKKDEMKTKVLEYIERNDHVSYAELEWLFEQNDYDYKGELDALSERCEHVVFWTGWQQEAYDMLGELISEGKVHREPTTFLTYLIDGKTLLLPQVKRNTQYKQTIGCRQYSARGRSGSRMHIEDEVYLGYAEEWFDNL